MQVTPHVYSEHINDKSPSHPGGSNIYFIGDQKEDMVILDTGEQDKEWTHQILKAYESLGRPTIKAILISHGHSDHIGGLDRIFEVVQAPVRCHPKLEKRLAAVVGPENVVKLKADERIRTGGGISLRAIFTPGHAIDHVCYHLPSERVMFTGDTILGASSSSVMNLFDYMKSLEKLSRHRVEIICPAHGPVVPKPRGSRLVAWYTNHRKAREDQIMVELRNGISDVDEIVKDIYPRNLKKQLRHAAAGNVRTHLAKLTKDGLVEETPASYRLKTK